MNETYSALQLSTIIDRSLVYQCACPAQVCRTLLELRDLFDYQIHCRDLSTTDRDVHAAIAKATASAHAEMERCLDEVLRLEGWNRETLELPEQLRASGKRVV